MLPLRVSPFFFSLRDTSVYYCNPSSPFQKPTVENNHEFIRRVLPKGSSFDDLTQADINLMMEHINSYTREKLNDKVSLRIVQLLLWPGHSGHPGRKTDTN